MSRELTWNEFQEMRHALFIQEQVEKSRYEWRGEKKVKRVLTKFQSIAKSNSVAGVKLK